MAKISKVVFGNETLIDLTNDSVIASALQSGFTAHGKDGEAIVGTCTKDVDSTDATAYAGDILNSKTAYARGSKITGTMPNIGRQISNLVTASASVAINAGYHDGSGSIGLSAADKSALIAENIREGIQVLGITGTMSGSEDVKATSFTATAYTTTRTYQPTDFGDYNYFAQLTVSSIAYSSTLNPAGGYTVTIGTVYSG